MLNLIAVMMPCLSLQAAVTVSETEAHSCRHKREKHSEELLQLSQRTQTQHFLSSQEAPEYDFNSILCVFTSNSKTNAVCRITAAEGNTLGKL